jgi:hypothetical protein
VLFVKTTRRLQTPRQEQFNLLDSQHSGSKEHGISGWPLTQLTWSAHVNQVGKKAAQTLGVFGPLLHGRSGLWVSKRVLLHKQLFRPMIDYACPTWRFLLTATSGSCKCCNPSVFALRLTHLGALLTCKLTRIWEFTSEH